MTECHAALLASIDNPVVEPDSLENDRDSRRVSRSRYSLACSPYICDDVIIESSGSFIILSVHNLVEDVSARTFCGSLRTTYAILDLDITIRVWTTSRNIEADTLQFCERLPLRRAASSATQHQNQATSRKQDIVT